MSGVIQEDSLFEDSFDDWETDDRNDDDSSDGERDGSSSTLGHAAENIPVSDKLPFQRYVAFLLMLVLIVEIDIERDERSCLFRGM